MEQYNNIPEAMRGFKRWALAGTDKSPYVVIGGKSVRVSPVSGVYMSFEAVVAAAATFNLGIGFVLGPNDPFVCIDLDIKDSLSVGADGLAVKPELWSSANQLRGYSGLVAMAGTYTEVSRGGVGLHLWLKGSFIGGRKGNGVEVYGSERFIVCTGNGIGKAEYKLINNVALGHFSGEPLGLSENKGFLDNFIKTHFKNNRGAVELVEVAETEGDDVIWDRALRADNADKFKQLCAGEWEELGYPSASEADFSLLSMLTFYSDSNAQVRRMFKTTILGQRAKHVKGDYHINKALEAIRGREARDAVAKEAARKESEALVKKLQSVQQEKPIVTPVVSTLVNNVGVNSFSDGEVVNYEPPADGITWPPGLVGQVASFIYHSGSRPVKEVAVVAALGLFAGMFGKAFNVGTTGINLYIVLVARSAIGKESMHSGLGYILRSMPNTALEPFVDFNDYVSAPALVKALANQSSFLNVMGEFGHKLRRMAEIGKDGNMLQFRGVMTNLYQKSGAGSVAGGLNYSNKDDNAVVNGALGFSMIGETTPGTFYSSLSFEMMEDGFLSRFNIIEYSGDRPEKNKNVNTIFPAHLAEAIAQKSIHCQSLIDNNNAIPVVMESAVSGLVDQFELLCDSKIRAAGDNESIRQVWNRAALKVIRLCGVLAAADNHIKPVITEVHFEWAKGLVMADVENMLQHIKEGDADTNGNACYKKLLVFLDKYLRAEVRIDSKRKDIDYRKKGAITRSFLMTRLGVTRMFKSEYGDRLGDTLNTAILNGKIEQINKKDALEIYNFRGVMFQIINVEE